MENVLNKIFGFLFLVGLVGCGDSNELGIISSSTINSIIIPEENYSAGILGTWNYYNEPHITFDPDGTAHYVGWETKYKWLISGSQLLITDTAGNLTSEYPYKIESMSETELIYVQTIDKVDGTGIIEETVVLTR